MTPKQQAYKALGNTMIKNLKKKTLKPSTAKIVLLPFRSQWN